MGSNKNNSLIRNAPILLIIAVWLPQIIYRALAENSPFESLATDTYFALFMATFSYLLGAYAGKLSLSEFKSNATIKTYANNKGGFSRRYIFLRLLLIILAVTYFLRYLGIPMLQGADVSNMRDMALSEWSEGGYFIKLFAIGVNSLACTIVLFASFEYELKRKVNYLLLILFIMVCIASYARTMLLIGLFIFVIRLASDLEHPIKTIVMSVLGFIAIFLFLGLTAKDNSDLNETALNILKLHAEVYFFGGVAGLNNYIINSDPQYQSILTIPRFVQDAIPIGTAMPPQYFDFVNTPVPLNVFTAIFPPLHDFGYLGVVGLFFVYGLTTAIACKKFVGNHSYFWQVCAGFLLYASAMSIFDDQFIRGLPVLLIFVAVSLIFKSIYRYIR